jgi:hypothetical protein
LGCELRHNATVVIPHEFIKWAIQARKIREYYLALRGDAASGTMVMNMTEAVVLVSVMELLRHVELSLKERLYKFLSRQHGGQWWHSLPAPVRQNCESRRKWTVAEIGSRRTLGSQNIAWLSMGDVMRVLKGLSANDWRQCLNAENSRKSEFHRTLRKVKSFRDYHIAHPKPRRSTNSELAALCRQIELLPGIFRPKEWASVNDLLGAVRALPPGERQAFHHLAIGYPERDKERLLAWLRSPFLTNGERPLDRARVLWRSRVIGWCGDTDPGGQTFFGIER